MRRWSRRAARKRPCARIAIIRIPSLSAKIVEPDRGDTLRQVPRGHLQGLRQGRARPRTRCQGQSRARCAQIATRPTTSRRPRWATGIKDSCLCCHKDAVSQHKDWLPNTARHFEAISCPVCHAPDAKRRVNLRLYDSVDANASLPRRPACRSSRSAPTPPTSSNVGLDETALWSLLKEFNQDRRRQQDRAARPTGGAAPASRRTRSATSPRPSRTATPAIKPGAEPFQSVTLTIAGPDGRPLRHGVQEGRAEFTACRWTRCAASTPSAARASSCWTILLVLVVLGAISVPIGHMTIKRLFKGMRQKLEAERVAAQADAKRQAATDENTTPDGNTKIAGISHAKALHPSLAGQDLALDQCLRLRPADCHRPADPLSGPVPGDVVQDGRASPTTGSALS